MARVLLSILQRNRQPFGIFVKATSMKTTFFHGGTWPRLALAGVLGVLAFGLGLGRTTAQDKDKDRHLIKLGYTRPGTPDDKINPDGKIRPAALDPDVAGHILGGTVYFAVYERTGTEGDSWGLGLEKFNDRFVEGKSFKHTFSPNLDTKAKYLYLYQIVNDRGLDTNIEGVAFAVDGKEIPSEPIAGFALKLIVDPRYITSWGFFKNTAFAVTVPDINTKGDIRPAVDGKDKTSDIRLAVSSNPSVLAKLPYHRYSMGSPAFPLRGDLRNTFGLGAGTLNLKDSFSYKQLEKRKGEKGVVLAAWEQNVLEDAVAAKEPEYVQLLYADPDSVTSSTAGELGTSVFRADFRLEKQIMKLGQHSVVFGFTSDLPPTEEPIRIESPEANVKAKGNINPKNKNPMNPGAKFDAAAPALASAGGLIPLLTSDVPGFEKLLVGQVAPAPSVGATGIAPTPVPPAPVGTPLAGAGAATLGGGAPALGGGGGVGGGFPGVAGGIGFARPGVGGSVIGTGGGQGAGQGQTGQEQQPNQNGNQNINFTATLTNQQAQAQAQAQSQSQTSTNNGGFVVPEPGTIILSLLGLPALFVMARRRLRTQEV